MKAPPYARLAARVLSRHAPPVSDAHPSAEARLAAISALDRVIARTAMRRRAMRWTGAVAVAAAIAMSVGLWRHLEHRPQASAETAPPDPAPVVAYPLGGGASLWVGVTRVPLTEGGRVAFGTRVETAANGRAAVAFASGTSAMLGESAELTVGGDDATQVLRLDAGSVDLHVAKVSAEHRFLVATPDAEVEVRGTKFRLSIGPADPSCNEQAVTHLVVTEGLVVVRHAGIEKRIAAGEQWPSDCIPPVEISARAPNVAPATSPSIVSSLAEQNDLFSEAIMAKHRGDVQAAVGIFDRLLIIYPASPLAQSAAVERMRLLRVVQPSRAIAAARQYVARYPNGFARGEAEAIVTGGR
ncbi:MAG TPA: FecR family protein [Polyangiaceae bacterium]|nr:FecR family protein [Polyangiaceae bacterium]